MKELTEEARKKRLMINIAIIVVFVVVFIILGNL